MPYLCHFIILHYFLVQGYEIDSTLYFFPERVASISSQSNHFLPDPRYSLWILVGKGFWIFITNRSEMRWSFPSQWQHSKINISVFINTRTIDLWIIFTMEKWSQLDIHVEKKSLSQPIVKINSINVVAIKKNIYKI